MPDLWDVSEEHDTSVCSTELYNSMEQKVERKKNLKLLELLETENKVKLPLISPCSQSCADEIKAESLFFDKYRNLNKIPRPTKMIDCINSKTLFNTSTLIDTAIHGTAEEKDEVIGTMKEYLGLAKEDDLYNAEPELSRNKYRTAVIDVGGTHYRTKIINFVRFPASRLGKIFQAKSTKEILLYCDGYTPGNPPVLYFDRSDENFTSILDIYRFEELHLCGENCALVIKEDLEFWGLDEIYLEPCCALKFYPQIVSCQKEVEEEKVKKEEEKKRERYEDFGSTMIGKWRTRIWNFLEYPETSKPAKALAFMSLFLVCVSIITFMIGTNYEDVGHDEENADKSKYIVKSAINTIDSVAVLFFSLEYFVRLIFCPRKWKFVTDKMNIIDFLAIAPYFLSAVLAGLEDMQVIGKAGNVIRLIRIMRILRVFKMVRHFSGMQSLMYTLQKAYKELGLLCIMVCVAILLFASLIFAVEADGPDKDVWSFHESFWWGLMTLTTVGYNYTPATFGGKLVFGLCATSGIFLIYLPIPIVVTSFASCYRDRLWRSKIAIKKRALRQKKQSEEMIENKRSFLTFPHIGVHISNSILNLISQEDSEGQIDDSSVPLHNGQQIIEEDISTFNVEDQVENDQNEPLLESPTESEKSSIIFPLDDLANFNQPDIVRSANRTFTIQHTDV